VTAGLLRRRAAGPPQQFVKAVEVDVGVLDAEAIRLVPCHDQLACARPIRAHAPAKHRDEGLERAARALRRMLAPEELCEALRRHEPASGRQQDLEHLFWTDPTEVAGAKRAAAVLDGDRPEQPDPEVVRAQRVIPT
jgi:hypothetical protein